VCLVRGKNIFLGVVVNGDLNRTTTNGYEIQPINIVPLFADGVYLVGTGAGDWGRG
jgi:hypothetical protein